ncbi:MAG TPA: bifunctional demethylmenaquinone methyltransferase/2-methoxy-6-polyprenyl-1,4-benzoquinol methylase UbiE [Blastocatellia bacterium]|nr:bifunctional demethylmenaquinone methyltransferase/2-methoxy-6-polyprenyl-1,4-benzoquinol methylase UbiE [Blastocatellia bacterium]
MSQPEVRVVSERTSQGNEVKSARVRSMFNEIAPRYDFLNHLLSLGIDKRWRRFTRNKVKDVLSKPGARVLDLCCGTGDLLLEIAPLAESVGLDFCRPMLLSAKRKIAVRGGSSLLVEGDAMECPFRDGQFDAITIAFGLRNLECIESGLSEIYRLLKAGGRAGILEFSTPIVPVFRNVFELYFRSVLPRIGGVVSGSTFAYRYLHDSVKDFPDQKTLANSMREVGFLEVKYYNLSGGIAALHLGERK